MTKKIILEESRDSCFQTLSLKRLAVYCNCNSVFYRKVPREAHPLLKVLMIETLRSYAKILGTFGTAAPEQSLQCMRSIENSIISPVAASRRFFKHHST